MLPERNADTMSEAIALSSPNGRMSKRAKEAAQERIRVALFGREGLALPQATQPTEKESLMRQAATLRDLASRGMCPRKYIKRAEALERKAAAC